jgi:hypothetical protein
MESSASSASCTRLISFQRKEMYVRLIGSRRRCPMQWDVHLEVAPFVVRPQEKRARSELGMQDGLNIYFMQCVEDVVKMMQWAA